MSIERALNRIDEAKKDFEEKRTKLCNAAINHQQALDAYENAKQNHLEALVSYNALIKRQRLQKDG